MGFGLGVKNATGVNRGDADAAVRIPRDGYFSILLFADIFFSSSGMYHVVM
jgi:hypothetical protein